MRGSAAGSAAPSRIGRINRFMVPHIHNFAIVAILSETGGAPATFDALHPREVDRQRISRAAGSVSWILWPGGNEKLPGGGSKHLRRLDSGRSDALGSVARDGDPGGIPVGVPRTYWLQTCRRRMSDSRVHSTDGGSQI